MKFDVISPETTEELLTAITERQGGKFRFGAGYTDLVLHLKKQSDEKMTVVNLARLNDDSFISMEQTSDGFRIGALVTINEMMSDGELRRRFPVLVEAASVLGSRQIRQVATVGGNVCTASPAGDVSCALASLEAKCELLSSSGKIRVVPIDKFFVGVRQTDLKNDEVLRSVVIESQSKTSPLLSRFIKVGTRRSMECSVVSLACHFEDDEDQKIFRAGVAIGSVAPTVRFVKPAGDYLLGRTFDSINSAERKKFAETVLSYASPISDIRASAWYRKEVLYKISESVFEN